MVSPLARGDYDDLVAEGLKPTLEDFDRLNQIALRLTNGGETTAANFPRIGWAGDVPFFQPTCAAFAWYLEFVERAAFDTATKDACWFYALAHAREAGAFDFLRTPTAIRESVTRWIGALPVTRQEIARACRYAATGFDDAAPAKADGASEPTDEERREDSLVRLSDNVAVTSALTGVAPSALMAETPSRLARMVDEVRASNPSARVPDKLPKLRADYDLTYREIRRRLKAEREAETAS